MPLTFDFAVTIAESQFAAGFWTPSGMCRLLQQVGSSLYYVTISETGDPSTASFNLFIQKSTDGGSTWSTVFDDFYPPGLSRPRNADRHAIAVVGSSIYIFYMGTLASTGEIYVSQFDTASDTITRTTASGLFWHISGNGLNVAPYPDGKIIVAYNDKTTNYPQYAFYTPATDTWSTATEIEPNGVWEVDGVVVDPLGPRAYVIMYDGDVSLIAQVVLDTSLGTQVTIASDLTPVFSWRMSLGTPAISNGRIVVPYEDPSHPDYTDRMVVATAAVADSPTFTKSVIESGSIYTMRAEEQFWFSSAAVDIEGNACVFWWDCSNKTEDSSSQATLKYVQSTGPGTWTSPQTIYTPSLPSVGLSIYPFAIGSSKVGVLFGWVDPTVYLTGPPDHTYESLTVQYLEALSSGAGGAIAFNEFD